jgi:hypothetical protein
MQRSRLVWMAAVLGVLGLPGAAAAQISDWQVVDVVPGEPTEKVKDPPPNIRIRVTGEPAPRGEDKDRLKLELDPDDNPRRLRGVSPIAVVPFHRSADTLAIAVVIEGHQYYFGNDTYTTEGTRDAGPDGIIRLVKVSKGVYEPIRRALDESGGKPDEVPSTIAGASANAASKAALIVYSVGADVRHPMRPIAELNGDKLGAQELQKSKTGRDLAEGLRTALAQLKGVPATRRVIFLISDGYDDGAVDEIKGLRRQLSAEKIDVFAFHLAAPTLFIPVEPADLEKNKQRMRALGEVDGSAYLPVPNADGLARKIADAVGAINSRYYLTFPGQVENPRSKTKTGFDWDGKEHEVRLLRDDEPVDERKQLVAFVPVWGQPRPKSRWLMWTLIGGGAAAVLGLVLLIATRKPAPVEQPVVVAAPVFAPPPPSTIQPIAGGGNKTMAINLNAGDGVPVVGWIVPINGPQQYQTFKLFAGVTKVGNVHGAHILINDAFMSGEHAHFVMSPNGFTLIDNGSTNGTLVNERRVQRHDLIDNDVIKFGKTDCKFKTINTDT